MLMWKKIMKKPVIKHTEFDLGRDFRICPPTLFKYLVKLSQRLQLWARAL